MKNFFSFLNRNNQNPDMSSDLEDDTLLADKVKTMENNLELVQKAGKMGVWDYNIAKNQLYVSDQLVDLFQMTSSTSTKLTFERFLESFHPDYREEYRNQLLQSIKAKKNFHYETQIIRKDGTSIYADVSGEIILDKKGKPVRFVGVFQDISNQKHMEEELHQSESKLKNLANNLQAGIWTQDLDTFHIWISKGIEAITGYNREGMKNEIIWESIVHPSDKELYKEQLKKMYSGETLLYRYRIIHETGKIIWIQNQMLPVYDDDGNLTRLDGIITDISNQKEYEEKIKHLAFHDSLTDLPNRTFFDEKLVSLIERSKQKDEMFSIMYLDLDRFRNINNSIGQVIGDKLLQEISQRINGLLNASSLLAKTDGDEFGILLWDYKENDFPITIAKSIKHALSKPFLIDGFELYVTASVGISSYPDNGHSAEELMKNTDIALSRAKNNGKNTFQIYSTSLNIDSYKQYHLEKDLRKSIDNNQLRIYYQPRVDTTGKIVSAEALIRWEHPIWGLVSPAEFIPLSEETGFVNDIADWVLQQTCLYLKEWEKENLSVVPISINVSAQRFMKSDWKETINAILQETNTDPTLIQFEITETTLIQYKQSITSAFEYLRELGIKIALDDFGTGYSSLSYLYQFPIDLVKIDRSFIKQITKSEKMEVIIKSIIYMSKGLNIDVVAEGVETISQLAFLKQQECHEIQGYIFSKPVPVHQFQELLKRMILKIEQHDGSNKTPNRRKYFRIPLTFPIRANMTLIALQEKKVNVGTTEVLIEDIGPGGLRFLSNIQLPVQFDITYQFKITILDENIVVIGKVVWKEEIKGSFEYGIEFNMDNKERDQLIKILNQLSVQIRRSPFVPNSNILNEDRFIYLNKKKIRNEVESPNSRRET
ncbi:EAL domain-containing protein [Oceanobacillus salinisoli]|uniref:EAL domain-containing protein n=1 Tax=Oceanobacillus salinisoli TaxID=2678611 RepID=UPI0012E13E63|nr:EAL domain-containing protein [Oceanobacillus salinisoli]